MSQRHLLVLVALLSSAMPRGNCDTYGYFINSVGLCCWNVDRPHSEPLWTVPLEAPLSDLVLTPEKRRLLAVIWPNKIEGLSPWDLEHQERVGAYVVVDVCNPKAAKTTRILQAESFDYVAGISSDGQFLYVRGNPKDDICQLSPNPDHSFKAAYFIIDIATGTVKNIVCANHLWIGAQGRIYYPQFNPNQHPGALMSRNAVGEDEKEEVGSLPHLENRRLTNVFGFDDRSWFVFSDMPRQEMEGSFAIYTLTPPDEFSLTFTHAGTYLGQTDGRISYGSRQGQGSVALLHPEDDQIITRYLHDFPAPSGLIGSLCVSPDGKKHYYVDDHGERARVDFYVFNLNSKTWSDKLQTPFNGGGPGWVLLDDPCLK